MASVTAAFSIVASSAVAQAPRRPVLRPAPSPSVLELAFFMLPPAALVDHQEQFYSFGAESNSAFAQLGVCSGACPGKPQRRPAAPPSIAEFMPQLELPPAAEASASFEVCGLGQRSLLLPTLEAGVSCQGTVSSVTALNGACMHFAPAAISFQEAEQLLADANVGLASRPFEQNLLPKPEVAVGDMLSRRLLKGLGLLQFCDDPGFGPAKGAPDDPQSGLSPRLASGYSSSARVHADVSTGGAPRASPQQPTYFNSIDTVIKRGTSSSSGCSTRCPTP
eukprot:CAMPEP_0170585860 /NCGR_PEP_ID=MMETSP0224-20130122/9442_1 /TAXON_ID=285029 /ORGANISM="Togula jolla, Strain CCCM 725" /LENGTH=278 /DNA_ID=CAMNT_0010909379 /DNA_START=48 /DNA_END=880 /DNA_ORIENTATION=-